MSNSDNIQEDKVIKIQCPICNSVKFIAQNKIDIISNKDRGLMSGLVQKDIICEHSFSIFIDRNGDVRTSDTFDLEIGKGEEKEDRGDSFNWIAKRLNSPE